MDDNQRSATPGCERRAQAQLLVALSGAALDRIRLMKTLFLVWYRHGRPPEGPFFFKPYLYGPCSFEVYRELDKLQAAGLVVQPNPSMQGRYFLTSAGQGCCSEGSTISEARARDRPEEKSAMVYDALIPGSLAGRLRKGAGVRYQVCRSLT